MVEAFFGVRLHGNPVKREGRSSPLSPPMSLCLSLAEFGTYSYPLESLSGVLDCMANTTVESQWAGQSVQVVEEFWVVRTGIKRTGMC